jgi:phi13 family phage major tail protein
MANKVTFGIKNLHYATFTANGDGTVLYNAPVSVPGTVSIGLDPLGEMLEFYADDMLYFAGSENSGYQGPLEIARVPDQFRIDVFGDTMSSNGLLIENVEAQPRPVALMFEFSGDQRKRRVVLYNCAIQRPGIASTTNTNTKTINTSSMQVTASPRPDGVVRACTTDDTESEVYNNWYTSVPSATGAGVPQLSALTIGSATLTPTFAADVTTYDAATTTSTGAVTATASTGVAVAITVDGVSIASGDTVTWAEGENIVRIIATKDGVSNTYTVRVNYTAA